MRALIGVVGTAGAAGSWLVAQTGDPAPTTLAPYAIQLGVGGVFLWFCLRLQGDLKAERKTHDELITAMRSAASAELAAERAANREALRQERDAHLQAMRAERDAHVAELVRERGEVKQLYDRVVDKVVPTMEASMHVVNEARRALAERPVRVVDRDDRRPFDPEHGRQMGS